jgi:hypothetical protein
MHPLDVMCGNMLGFPVDGGERKQQETEVDYVVDLVDHSHLHSA